MTDYRRPPTVQEVVLDSLLRAIHNGELSAGSTIRPDEIAAKFGVSRIPVREALKMLEGQGLVEHSARSGYSVPLLSIDDAMEIYEIRSILETEALRRAIKRRTPEAIAAAQRALDAASLALTRDDPNAYSHYSNVFHYALLETCGMQRLMRMIETIWESTETYRPARALPAAEQRELHHEHLDIFDCYARGDIDALLAACDMHRAHLLDVVLDILPR